MKQYYDHLVIKSGDMYLTHFNGYTKDIGMAMFVRADATLVGKQRFVKVRAGWIVREIITITGENVMQD